MSGRDGFRHFSSVKRPLRLLQMLVIQFSVVGLILVVTALAFAGSGDLDPSFGSNGVVTPDFLVNAVAVQPDGKIVVCGDDGGGDTGTGRVVRYLPDGTVDATFGDNGVVETAVPLAALALQADGKIVVAGRRTLIRLNSTGSFDTSLGGSGIITTDTSINQIADVELTVKNQLIIFGYTTNSLAIARYTSAGSRDLSFNGTGEVNTGFVRQVWPGPNGNVLPQLDGKLIAVGTGSGNTIELIRYNANGSLDTSFGVNGHVSTSSSTFFVQGALQQPDGKVVAWGIVGPPPSAFWLARYDVQGNLDPTFGSGGISLSDAFHSVGWLGTLVAATLQHDGKFIIMEAVGGFARFLPNGQLDSSFGTDGVAADNRFIASSLALQGDANFIVGGRYYVARRHLLGLTAYPQTVTPIAPDPGQLITYTFSLKNAEAVTITHITISDPLPAELNWSGPLGITPPMSATFGQPPAVVQDLTLTPGQAVTLTLPMTIDLSVARGALVTHTLTVASDQTGLVTSTVVITTAGPPLPRDDVALTGKNLPVVLHVLNNDRDPNNDVLSLLDVGTPLSGTASLLGDTVLYTPTFDFVGTDIFTYTVSDGRFTAIGTVQVVIAEQLFRLYLPVLWPLGPVPAERVMTPEMQFSATEDAPAGGGTEPQLKWHGAWPNISRR